MGWWVKRLSTINYHVDNYIFFNHFLSWSGYYTIKKETSPHLIREASLPSFTFACGWRSQNVLFCLFVLHTLVQTFTKKSMI